MRGRFQPTPLTNVPLGDEEEDGGDGHNSDIPFQNEGEKNSLEKAAPLQLEKSEESYLSRRSESGYHLVMSDSSSMRHQRTQSIDSASSSNAAPSALSWKILNKGTVNLRDFVLTQDGVFLSGKRLDLEVIPMDDIDTEGLELIGKGASGTVYKARHKPTGKLLALKKIRVEERKHRDEITKELSVLQRMNSQSCPYLTRHYGAYYDAESSTIDMPMEWMDGTLTTAIHLVGYIWEDVLRLIAYQVVQALVVLHRSHVIHRDIKPGNILLNGDGYVKVSDFGISKVVGTDGDQMGCTFVGTQVYMSPERLVSEGPHSYSSDIWALGLTLVQCATGRNPWYTVVPEGSPVNVFVIKNCTDQGLCPRLHHDAPDTNAGHPEPGQSPQPSQVPDTSKGHPPMDTKKSTMWSPAACNFIECCVQIDPQARPTATQLTHHPFLRGITDASATQGIKAFVVNLARLASVYKKKHARTNSGALEKALSALDEMIQGGKAGSP